MEQPTDLQNFPPEAIALIVKIEAMLSDALALLAAPSGEPAAFALRATKEQYLPETLQSYLAVPAGMRNVANIGGRSALSILMSALATLERATANHLTQLSAAKTNALYVQDQFLKERFANTPENAQSADIVVDHQEASATISTVMLRSLFEHGKNTAGETEQAILETFAQRFLVNFPTVTTVERTFLRRIIVRVSISIPIRNGLLKYTVSKQNNRLETAVAKIMHNVALKSEVLPADVWIDALVDHLVSYTNEDQQRMLHLRGVMQ